MKTKRNLLQLFSLMLAILAMASCTENEFKQDQPDIVSIEEMEIPGSFSFETTKDITLDMVVADEASKFGLKTVITIYDISPAEEGNIISKKVADETGALIEELTIPAYLESLFVQVSVGAGITYVQEIEINGNYIQASLMNPGNAATKSASIVAPPSCDNCDETVSASDNSIIVDKNNDVYCIPDGVNFSGNVRFEKSGTIKICGTVTITNFDMWSNAKPNIIVTETGTLNITTNVNLNKQFTIENWNVISSTGKFELNNGGEIYNYGSFTCDQVQFNSNAEMYNYNTFTATANMEMNSSGQFNNYATATFEKNLNINSSAVFNNECKMLVNGNLNLNNQLVNNGYIKVDGRFTKNNNGSQKLILGNGSYMALNDLTINGHVNGPAGSYARMDVNGNNVTLNGNKIIDGKIDFCAPNYTAPGWSNYFESFVTFCEAFITETECIPGAGSDPDSDDDGIADDQDDYPNDPTKAFNSYYPNENTFGTLAFEDLWPFKGDYDFNDFVVGYNYKEVSNANNEVVELVGKFKTKALGASFTNGFGIYLPDLDPENVASITGTITSNGVVSVRANKTETGQSGSSVIIYDDIFEIFGLSYANVRQGGVTLDAETTTVTIVLAQPQENIGAAPYNPFIFIDGERGKEVHLINNAPTDLADNTLFGTGHDASSGSVYYKTASGLPWAINIPTDFDQMLETNEITTGYLKFVEWAESGGVAYPDWYVNQQGYRNDNNIYYSIRHGRTRVN